MDIVNVVISGDLNQSIDLKMLLKSKCIDYNPEIYHGGYVRLSKYSVTIYRSGKYIVPGVKNILDIPQIFDELKAVLKNNLDVTLFGYPEIKNIVAMSNYNNQINLSLLAVNLINNSEDCNYEPEIFPGLIWKMDVGTANIFSSGKIVILGVKDVNVLLNVEKKIMTELNSVNF